MRKDLDANRYSKDIKCIFLGFTKTVKEIQQYKEKNVFVILVEKNKIKLQSYQIAGVTFCNFFVNYMATLIEIILIFSMIHSSAASSQTALNLWNASLCGHIGFAEMLTEWWTKWKELHIKSQSEVIVSP